MISTEEQLCLSSGLSIQEFRDLERKIGNEIGEHVEIIGIHPIQYADPITVRFSHDGKDGKGYRGNMDVKFNRDDGFRLCDFEVHDLRGQGYFEEYTSKIDYKDDPR